MKLEVFTPKETREIEEPVYLALEQCGPNVIVKAVTADGCDVLGGNLLIFRSDGTIGRCASVLPRLGFKLGQHSAIEID